MSFKGNSPIHRFSRWMRGFDHDHDESSVDDTTHLLRSHFTTSTPQPRQRTDGVSSFHVLDDQGIKLSKKTSVTSSLPQLTTDEQYFFKLIEAGNTKKVKQYLEANGSFNINCINYQGYSGLVLAVKNEDIDMVKYLLKWESLEIGDAFLHAIDSGNLGLVETIIDACAYINMRQKIEYMPSEDNSVAFPPKTTPVMLAAQGGHFEIIRFLIQRGHKIKEPCQPLCNCIDCQNIKESENYATEKLNVYHAITNPTYICQTGEDPIEQAFILCTQLKQEAKVEREYSDRFLQLANKCSKFSVDILDQCRNQKEVSVLIHRKSKEPSVFDGRFSRIGLAIYHDQKDFVAHSSCQQALNAAWLEGFPHWKRLSPQKKMLKFCVMLLMIPITIIVHLFIPQIPNIFGFNKPLVKYISYTMSYICFLSLLMIQAMLDRHKNQRGPPDTGTEVYIILYIIALLFQNVKTIWRYGMKNFVSHKWNIYDLVMIVVFLIAFLCWGWSLYDLGDQSHISYTQRRYWSSYEATLIAESVYSLATVIAFGRITFFFQISTGIGPLQLSFSRMFHDIINFFFIFLAVLLAFAIGLYKLYHNYEGMVKSQGGEIIRQEDAFTTFENTMATLYWALYGYGGPGYADLVVSEYMERDGNETIIIYNHHRFTEMVGRTIYAVYHIAGIIILFNMLIAMLTSSLTIIQENADAEWKFNRSRVWMRFLQKGGTLPPPFNIIPTPKGVWWLGKWIFYRLTGNISAGWNIKGCCTINQQTTEEIQQEEHVYFDVMAYLVQRYFTKKDNIKEESAATKEDIEAIHYNIRDLRDIINELWQDKTLIGLNTQQTLKNTSISTIEQNSKKSSASSMGKSSSNTIDQSESSGSVFI